jgi:hypothetical protein
LADWELPVETIQSRVRSRAQVRRDAMSCREVEDQRHSCRRRLSWARSNPAPYALARQPRPRYACVRPYRARPSTSA